MFPYPLLAAWTGDYVNRDFGLSGTKASLRSGEDIVVDIEFRLNSEYLDGLIKEGAARYAVTVSCPKTFAQTTHELSSQDSLLLKATDYTERNPSLRLTSWRQERSPGLRRGSTPRNGASSRPGGFNIPEAGILAVGSIAEVRIENTGVKSVIDLVANPNVNIGQFSIDLEDERIKIYVAPEDKVSIEAIRQRKNLKDSGYAGLFASIYLSAVAEAVRNLGDYPDTRWAFAIGIALDRCGVADVSDSANLSEQAIKYAQMILDNPMSGFLQAATGREDEE